MKPTREDIDRDAALIDSLGGAGKVADLLGWEKEGSVQRVQNWKSRGIPAAIKLARPDLFLPHLRRQRIAAPAKAA